MGTVTPPGVGVHALDLRVATGTIGRFASHGGAQFSSAEAFAGASGSGGSRLGGGKRARLTNCILAQPASRDGILLGGPALSYGQCPLAPVADIGSGETSDSAVATFARRTNL
jgi:hypothetical protein